MKQQLSRMFRGKRDVHLKRLIESRITQGTTFKVLDMGGTVAYWERFGYEYLRRNNVHVTILNLHPTELGNGPAEIFATSAGDACNLSMYADKSFDLTHSNSVIEHVRTWSNMRAFGAEARRVGVSYYLQTPNYWFPIDPHYFKFPLIHWLPAPCKAWIFKNVPVAHAGRAKSWESAYEWVDAARLLSFRQLSVIFPDADIIRERLLLLSKSFVCIGPSRETDHRSNA